MEMPASKVILKVAKPFFFIKTSSDWLNSKDALKDAIFPSPFAFIIPTAFHISLVYAPLKLTAASVCYYMC